MIEYLRLPPKSPADARHLSRPAPLRRGCGKLLPPPQVTSLRPTRLVREIGAADAEGWGEAAGRGVEGNRRRKSLYRTRIRVTLKGKWICADTALWPGVVIFNPCRTDGYGLQCRRRIDSPNGF